MTSHAAHLAKTVFSHFPYADIYTPRQWKKERPIAGQEPGEVVICGDGKDQRFVANLLGQYYPGMPRFPESPLDGFAARQEYFRSALRKLAYHINWVGPAPATVAFPWGIGCGAAGGSWSEYEKMIKEFSDIITETVSIYKLC